MANVPSKSPPVKTRASDQRAFRIRESFHVCRKTGEHCGVRDHSGRLRIHSEGCSTATTFKSLARNVQTSPAFIYARLGRESWRVGRDGGGYETEHGDKCDHYFILSSSCYVNGSNLIS